MFNFPWEKNIKPDFVNPEGFEWYIEKHLTDWAKREDVSSKPLVGVLAFLVRYPETGIMDYVLINTNQQVLYTNINLEAMAVYIDILRLKQTLDKVEEKPEVQNTGFGKNRKRKYTK